MVRRHRSRTFNLKNQYGLTFDGVNEYINIDNILDVLSSTITGTISFWAKVSDSTPSAAQTMIQFGDTDNLTYLQSRVNSNGVIRILCATGSLQWDATSNNIAFTDNQWVHIAIVQNGISPVLYLDGSLAPITFAVSTDKTKWFSGISGLDNGRIGNESNSNLGERLFFNGNFDEVAFFNTNLSAAQVLEIYNNGKPTNLQSHSKSSNLVAYYRLGDAAASYDGTNWQIPDDSINDNTGSSVNMELQNLSTGAKLIPGWSFNYDGVNEDFLIPTQSIFDFTGSFSLSSWVKLRSTGSNQVFQFRSAPPPYPGYAFESRVNGAIALTINGGTGGASTISNTLLSINTWNHVACTKTPGSVPKLYINGGQTGYTGTSSVDPITNTSNVRIGGTGGISGWTSRQLNGHLNHASFWGTELSLNQINELYNSGSPADLSNHSAVSNLISWYREERSSFTGSNWILKDQIGNYHGTSSNMEFADLIPDAPHTI